jgi:hypothetical protein
VEVEDRVESYLAKLPGERDLVAAPAPEDQHPVDVGMAFEEIRELLAENH